MSDNNFSPPYELIGIDFFSMSIVFQCAEGIFGVAYKHDGWDPIWLVNERPSRERFSRDYQLTPDCTKTKFDTLESLLENSSQYCEIDRQNFPQLMAEIREASEQMRRENPDLYNSLFGPAFR